MLKTNESASDLCCGEADEVVSNAPPHERLVCQCYAPTCSNYLCAVCGVAVPWRENLMIANPTISGRFCDGCVDVEATYHGLSVEEMSVCRTRLRAKRIERNRLDFTRILEIEIGEIGPRVAREAFRPERSVISPSLQSYLERGEACWCHRAKDCDGNHEFHNITAVNLCGLCGETFEISKADPHWSSGRGPICPKRS